MPFWRAEVARLSLFMSNIEFEDFRITDEDLKYLKAHGKLKDGTSIPFRQLPVLVLMVIVLLNLEGLLESVESSVACILRIWLRQAR